MTPQLHHPAGAGKTPCPGTTPARRQDLLEKAGQAALNTEFGREALEALTQDLQDSGLSPQNRQLILAEAWKRNARAIAPGTSPSPWNTRTP